MEIARVASLSYLKCSEEQREVIDAQVLHIWSRSATMMHAVWERFGADYVDLVPPNPFYLNRPEASGDATVMKFASQKIRAISYGIWPRLLDKVRQVNIDRNSFCLAVDAFEDVQEDVLADAFGHIKPHVERVIAEWICDHILNYSFAGYQIAAE